MLKLRDYQQEAIAEVRREWQEGHRRTLVVASTGTGKTAMFLALLDQLHHEDEQARMIVVAHTEELIYQPVEKAREYELDIANHMGIVMAGQSDDDALCVVATIQTLSSNGRLDKILAHGLPQYVVLDESHHAPSGTYKRFLQRLDEAGADPLVAGFTATPIRTDRDGLSQIFQSCAYRFTIDKGIERGVLVPFTALGFELPLTLDGIGENEDGWSNEPMGDLLKADNILQIVTEKWQEHAGDRQTILFTASVAQAHAQAEYMRKCGIAAEAVDGGTPKDERAQMLREYKAGRIQIMTTCNVLSEGFDAPETACIAMVCPTKSDLRYVQRLGRGLRPANGKRDCLVLDFAPKDEREMVFAGDVLGIPRKVAQAKEKAERSGILISALSMDLFGHAAAVDPSELTVRVLHYMTKKSTLAWTYEGNLAVAALNGDTTLALVLPDSERLAMGEALRRKPTWGPKSEQWYQWLQRTHVVVIRRDRAAKRTTAGLEGSYTEFELAQARASEIASKEVDDRLAKRKAGWRDGRPSPAQIKELHRLGIPVPETKGQASQLQCVAYAKQAIERWMERERDAYWGKGVGK